ncbi:hypothetical protein ABZ114_29235 [Streptomyces albidoflavus]|uniref:hypothetical protein n=1 Tax=Streptomyces TaxID=1883 RepID=UPI00063E8DB0|nr:hypothetical protein [Streptomyces sp. KE1]KLJ04844.1 hypothetical protein WQ59_00135 [Streptomyces sp. KE1]
MFTPSASRRARLAGIAALAAVSLTACSTDSPPQHSERLQRAAGLKTFQVETTPDLWEKTSSQRERSGPDLELEVKRKELDNGLIRIEFSGVALANYMRILDYTAHGGANSATWGRHRSAESIRMYNEIAGTLDAITKRPDPKDPPPRTVVDTGFIDAKGNK